MDDVAPAEPAQPRVIYADLLEMTDQRVEPTPGVTVVDLVRSARKIAAADMHDKLVSGVNAAPRWEKLRASLPYQRLTPTEKQMLVAAARIAAGAHYAGATGQVVPFPLPASTVTDD